MNDIATKRKKELPVKEALNAIILATLLTFFFWFSLSKIGIAFDFSFVNQYSKRLQDGFLTTIYISFASLILSLLIGTLTALMYTSKILILSYFAKFYITFIRGTPLIMQIYLFYYIVGTAVGIDNKFLCGVLILSIFEGAYISEIIRGGITSIDKTQLEVAKAVGFTKKQTIKFVVLPQMISATLPALTGQFASIIKDSSLLSVIAIIEITQTTREITAINYNLFEAYFVLGFLYLCLTLPISFLSKNIERRYAYENRN